MPPAQMHGDTTGGTEWFCLDRRHERRAADTIRVTEMTNYFSDDPTFTYTLAAGRAVSGTANVADQPGGTWTTFPNTTTTQVQYRQRELVTAMASATAADGFTLSQGPVLRGQRLERHADSGQAGRDRPRPGRVRPDVHRGAIDSKGNLGFTWMEGVLDRVRVDVGRGPGHPGALQLL